MKFKLATTCLVIGTFIVPVTSFATDVYPGTAAPERHADRATP